MNRVKNRWVFILIFVIILIGLVLFRTNAYKKRLSPTKNSIVDIELPTKYLIGSWIWNSPIMIDESKRTQILNFCKQEHINTLYLNIDNYIDIYETSDPNKKQSALDAYNQSLSQFIIAAKKQNISVYALTGNTLWANSDYSYIPLLMLNYALNNNFDGIQYDIEFYNQPEFKKNINLHSKEYLQLAATLVNQLLANNSKKNTFQIEFDVPYWLAKGNSQIPSLTWQGISKPVGHHLLDILDRYPNSSVVLMSYRNHTQGENGSIAISKDLLDYAKNSKNVTVTIGLETTQNSDKSITYYGQSKKNIKLSASDLINAYSINSHFKGIAIHDLESYITAPND